MKLKANDKFILEDPSDGGLVLVTEIEIDPAMIKNNFMTMKGVKFEVDYDSDDISRYRDEVDVVISFDIESVNCLD